MNKERLLQILLAPIISEKCTQMTDQTNQVAFIVDASATKPEIKAAVELLFSVEVLAVNVINAKGKAKRFGKFMGRRSHKRKAYVSLAAGAAIDFAQGIQ